MFDDILYNTEPQPEHISIDGLNKAAQAFISDVANTYQCSRDMIVTAAFVAVGTASGKKVKVFDGKYTNNLSLWYAAIARSGCNKSQPIDEVLKPLERIDTENYTRWQEQMEHWKAVKNNAEPQPVFQQVTLNNSTAEARYKVMSQTENGLLVHSDELRSFLLNLNRYSSGGDVVELLSIFDGKKVKINRKTEATSVVQHPFLSIMGGVQPSVLQQTFGSAELMGSGFNQRWLFTWQPDEVQTEYTQQSIADENRAWWADTINRAFHGRERTLTIEDDAKQVYIDYFEKTQRRMLDEDDYIRSVLAKLEIIVERIAACVHIINGEMQDEITADTMRYAVSMMAYYEGAARKVYDAVAATQAASIKKGDVVRAIFSNFDVPSQSTLAKALCVSQQYISKCINQK